MLKPITQMVGLSGRSVTVVILAAVALSAGGAGAAVAGGNAWPGHDSVSGPAWGGVGARWGAVGVGASARSDASAGVRDRSAAPTVTVGGNPIGVAVDQATRTVYVANNGDNTVSVINAATCNAKHTAGCKQHPPTVKVGAAPIGDAVDQKTDTVYVVNTGDGTVSVIDGKTCNAKLTLGCGKVQTIPVGSGPNVDTVDQATDTVYVANGNTDTVSVIDGATCNAKVTSGCGKTPPTVKVGSGPDGLGVDQKTDTIYATNFNDDSVSVINGATCNAGVTSGCGQKPATVAVGGPTDGAVVDEASHTVYVIYATQDLGAVAMINSATCNGAGHSSCGSTPATVQVGSAPIWVAENPTNRTVYIANQEDSDVSVLNAATCNVRERVGCVRPLPAIAAGFEAGAVDVDIATDTVYYSSQALNSVSVLNGASCNAIHTRGCTKFAPTTTVGSGPEGAALDQATNTVYASNGNETDLSVIDAAACNAGDRHGCDRTWPTVAAGNSPFAVAVNQQTDTIYATDAATGADAVSVIDGATCNTRTTSGCGRLPATVKVGNLPYDLAIDQATDTIYVANLLDDTVSVIDGATCSGTVHSGCGTPPATIAMPAGNYADGIGVDQKTDTVYVARFNSTSGAGHVSVIDGASCNGTVHSGCGNTPATVTVNLYAGDVAVDQRTGTVYVPDNIPQGFAGRVSVIDGATCNGSVHSGCAKNPPAMKVARPNDIAVNQVTGAVYVDSVIYSDTAVLNGATCNGSVHRGCGQTPKLVATGGYPGYLDVDQATDTVYVPDNVDGEVSFFRGNPHS